MIPENGILEDDIKLLKNRPNPADYGIGGQCKVVSGDWNDACGTASGFYMGQDLTNAPVAGWVYVVQLVHNELYIKQIAYNFYTNIAEYERIKVEGNWSPWDGNIKTATYEGFFSSVSTSTNVDFATMFPNLNISQVICFNVEIIDVNDTWDRTYAHVLKTGVLQVRSYAQTQAIRVRVTAFYK